MSEHKRLTARVEHGQNQLGVVNRELRPMVIRVSDEDGEPAAFVPVNIRRLDEGQGYFELIDQETDQSGCAAALYVPADMTTRYEIEFRVVNGDDSSAAVIFHGCITDPQLGEAVELPVTIGLKRTGRSIHPRADVPEMNPVLAPTVTVEIPRPALMPTIVPASAVPPPASAVAGLNDRWFSEAPSIAVAANDHASETPAVAKEPDPFPAPPAPRVVSAVLAAPVVPSTVARTPPKPRPVPEQMTVAKAAVAYRNRRPPKRRPRELPLRYLVAAVVTLWVIVGAGFLVMLVSRPPGLKNGRTTGARPDTSSSIDSAYALGDTAPYGR